VERLKLDVKFEEKLPDEDELKPLGGNRLRMLKRGVIRLDRQLDLHGLTRDEALSALGRFLHSARVAGEKAVLVITGKGVHSSEGPVLNQAVAAWLREQGKVSVSEYAPAPGSWVVVAPLLFFCGHLTNQTHYNYYKIYRIKRGGHGHANVRIPLQILRQPI